MSTTDNAPTTAANGAPLPPLPKDHLDHPENWTTGGDPATDSQKGFIKVLEGKHPELLPEGGIEKEGLSKSEGSEVIEKLKSGEKVEQAGEQKGEGDSKKDDGKEGKVEEGMAVDNETRSKVDADKSADPSGSTPSKSASSKRKSADAIEAAIESVDKQDESMQVDSDTSTAKHTQPAEQSTDASKTSEANSNGDGAAKDESDRPTKKAKTASTTNGTKASTTDDKEALSTPPAEASNGEGQAPSSPPADDVVTPPADSTGAAAESEVKEADKSEQTVPGDGHLDHPENWATGDEPATDKQKGFIKVLEKQKGAAAASAVGDVESLGKSEASEKIDELKSM